MVGQEMFQPKLWSKRNTHRGGGNYWAPLTRKRHTMPHSAQSQHANYWAPRTRKRHQQEHWPQRPTESSDPTQHAKGRTGDRPGPRKGATTRRNVTQGGGGWFQTPTRLLLDDSGAGQPRPTHLPIHIRRNSLREKMKFPPEARNLRPILGTQTFWAPVPPALRINLLLTQRVKTIFQPPLVNRHPPTVDGQPTTS